MRGVYTILNMKKKEVAAEEKKLKELLTKLEKLKEEEKELRSRLDKLNSLKVKNPRELGFKIEICKNLLKELQSIRENIESVVTTTEKQRAVLARKRGEVKALEKFIEKKKNEKLKREELQLERLIYEVLSSRFNS